MEFIYGTRKVITGIFEPNFYKCPACAEMHTTYIIIYSFYHHLFWIPVFPYKKEIIANCSSCAFVRNDLKFGPNLSKEFDEKKKEYKHPWWTWSLIILVLSIILIAIIF